MTDSSQLRNLDLNLLVVFDTVFRERSVGRAAQHLGLSQPAVSHALSRLRQALDDELFVRNGSGMQPTPRALELAPLVREGLEMLQAAVAPPDFAAELATRCFSLALSDYASMVILASLVRALRAHAPGVDLQLFPANRVDVVAQLDRGRIDLAITWVDEVPERLRRETLWEETEVYVVDRAHPVAAGGLSEEALLAFPQVVVDLVGFDELTEGGFLRERGLSRRVLVERAFAEGRLSDGGAKGRIMVTTPHYCEVMNLVEKTDLIGVLPRRVALAAAARHDIVLLEPPYDAPPAPIDMLWHKRRDADSGLRWLRDVLVQLSSVIS